MSENKECKTCGGERFSYGVAPHEHINVEESGFIGSTRFLSRDKWPDNFQEDPEAPNCGVWFCPECNPEKSYEKEICNE